MSGPSGAQHAPADQAAAICRHRASGLLPVANKRAPLTISTALENPSTRTLIKCWVAVWQSSGPPSGPSRLSIEIVRLLSSSSALSRFLECGLVVALYHRAFMAIDQDRAAIDECHAKRDGSTENYLRRTGLGPGVSSSG